MTKVYVSATFRDLQECRAAVQLALRRLRVEDMAMESYVAEDRRPLERCLADVANCDVYVGIFAWRYGFIPVGYDRSITELEYREALAHGKPCLIFLLDEEAPWPRTFIDRGADADKIEALRAELAERHMCSTFRSSAELAAMVTAAVANCLTDAGFTSGGGMPALSRDTLRQYFLRLRQHYGVLDLDALTPEQQTEDYLRISLTSIFVEQWVRKDPPPGELPRAWPRPLRSAGRPGVDDGPAAPDQPDLTEPPESYDAKPLRRLLDVLGEPEERAIVLLGDPGSGKSTAARYVALSLAGGPADERLSTLAGHLPLLIELRSYVTLMAEGRCESFIDYLDHRAGIDGLGIERAALLRHLGEDGRAVMILDGLDEIFDRPRREEVARQIANFAANHPKVRLIVTSRIIGYSRRILTSAGFSHYTLQDLDEEQTAEFLSNWYRLATRDRPEDAVAQRARLLAAMRHSHAMRELAGNPLLLTILAIVGKHQVLPRERWKLYDHAATVLVQQWDVDRHLHDRSEVGDFLDIEDKKELLRRLAYRMQAVDRGLAANSIDRAELCEVFERYLVERYRRDPPAARAIARAMIDQFRERNFILGRYDPRVYGFVHRTFLEFFCADAILAKFQHDQVLSFDELKELFRRHWADLSWREVLRLLAGALHENHTAALIQVLTREVNQTWPPGAFDPPPWNLALAVQCLAEVRAPHAAVARPAEDLLRRLVLLLEHGVSIDDRETARLIEEEILPAARAVGPNWPGRQVYLSWYRRRGVRVVWSPVSTHAARLAAVLSTPAERIDDLFDDMLGRLGESAASYASVAGLAEVAQLATAARESPAHQAATARARARLIARARDDRHAGVRLAAVQALGERFGADPEARDLLIDRVRADGYAGVRLAAVQALGERFHDEPQVRDLLRERARADEHASVRRAAVQTIGDRYGGDEELRDVVLGCLRTDGDAEVTRAAAQVLIERFGATRQVRTLLTSRAHDDTDPVIRRTSVRILGDRLATDHQVRTLLVNRIRADHDPGVLRAAARAVLDERGSDGAIVRDLLVSRAHADPDEIVRRTALQLLVESFDHDRGLLDLLVATARQDKDGDVRLLATRTLADEIGTDATVGAALGELALGDSDARIRLTAAQALVERVGMDTAVCDVLAGLARDDRDASVRLAAVNALADIVGRDLKCRDVVLERARADSDARVREAALRALTRHPQGSDEIQEVLVDRAHHDPDATVFALAATAVIQHGGPRPEVYALLTTRVRGDGNPRVRLASVRLLIQSFGIDAEVREVLLERIRLDPDPDLVREAAIQLAAQLGTDVEQCEVLMTRAVGEDPPVRIVAGRILGEQFGADRTVRELLIERAGNDPEVQVRREVLHVLAERLAEFPEVRTLLVERLRDHDWSVRATSLLALATHFGTDGQIRALLVNLARDDPDPGFRRRAGQVLTWLPDADPDDLPDA
ncbi:HEAT repeat domain-containing protein [Micromonospora sp. HM5-17]|uniref:HEAT repeat domain-containing protein n=1 Tax=Micromonospora sp. HM5-17 TaxID=2487710 RepID=UPI000F482049|nr:HEAT repeat domain-containing protein [Micromonospora sp. HM5-17]ROT33868.1 DUF4062 domain-containing protein [Micromonospora sp. HM5-17]